MIVGEVRLAYKNVLVLRADSDLSQYGENRTITLQKEGDEGWQISGTPAGT